MTANATANETNCSPTASQSASRLVHAEASSTSSVVTSSVSARAKVASMNPIARLNSALSRVHSDAGGFEIAPPRCAPRAARRRGPSLGPPSGAAGRPGPTLLHVHPHPAHAAHAARACVLLGLVGHHRLG